MTSTTAQTGRASAETQGFEDTRRQGPIDLLSMVRVYARKNHELSGKMVGRGRLLGLSLPSPFEPHFLRSKLFLAILSNARSIDQKKGAPWDFPQQVEDPPGVFLCHLPVATNPNLYRTRPRSGCPRGGIAREPRLDLGYLGLLICACSLGHTTLAQAMMPMGAASYSAVPATIARTTSPRATGSPAPVQVHPRPLPASSRPLPV